ncbi:hypothetical protein A6M27_13695 [Acidithiobacillus thiooxidans]|uniref:AAA family ATPase n=2 Tax=Acidithiobacillus thiooxidans TaxID=930 RepID=UPI0004673DF8|nr:AAA family ATPase [Acidithiobacillus thiooxidans]OCX72196.1 hypothetical protein A6O24_14340 [Acidithiobacillus thiooxidans]OCX83820.1 hypothetical protein A6O26_06200 [Acidithiobacillus thiooxidans]OCX86109.1 hypothetical protein A6M27_13695 [Acidithiobacillus thiooxidans]OFC50251.1 hypothetical protein BAE47_02845 [Acidithiobacillus thiooxidans]
MPSMIIKAILKQLSKYKTIVLLLLVFLLAWLAFGAGQNAGFADQKHIDTATRISFADFQSDLAHNVFGQGSLWVAKSGAVYFDGDLKGKPYAAEIVGFQHLVTPAMLTLLSAKHIYSHGAINFSMSPAVPALDQLAWANLVSVFGRMSMGLVYMLFAGVMLLYARQMMEGVMTNRFSIQTPDKTQAVRFADVAGMSGPKLEVSEAVDYLRDPRHIQSLGGRATRGVLLYGPPGNGKTLLAKAVAGEAGVPFIEQNASSFVQLYVGAGAMAVRNLFKQARKLKGCVIFIDEIDAIGTRRYGGAGGHDERLQTLNALLAEMDGFKDNSGILVIAATNALDQLDEALIRPGRFDRKVHVPLPGKTDRLQILEYYLNKLPRTDANPVILADRSSGFSAADLSHWVNEAAMEAARSRDTIVGNLHFSLSRERILIGPRNFGVVLSPEERSTTAWHEAGHAVVRMALGGKVDKVSILPRGQALGVTYSVQEEDRLLMTRNSLHVELRVLMGGRAAEEIFVGWVSAGASNDMERASQIARQAIFRMGLGSFGPYIPEGEALREKAELEAKGWVLEAYAEAKQILQNHQDAVTRLHDQLLAEDEVEAPQHFEPVRV